MTIKISWKTVVMIAGAAATVYAAYKLAKIMEEEAAETEKHKKEKLAGRDLDEEVNNATIKNERFDVQDRAKAYDVLSRYANRVEDATTIAEFDNALSEYEEVLEDISSDNIDEAMACLLIYADRQVKEDQKIKEKKDEDRERKRNQVERDKAMMIANAIKKINTTVNGNNDPITKIAINLTEGGRR